MRFVPALLASVLLASPASAGLVEVLDLTGTWVGEFKCTEYSDLEGKDKFKEEATLEITQVGGELIVDWDDGGYAGLVLADPKKPSERGTVSLIECDTDLDQTDGFAEMSILDVKIKRDKEKGKLKGEGNYNGGGEVIGECKWKFQLESAEDPEASGCE